MIRPIGDTIEELLERLNRQRAETEPRRTYYWLARQIGMSDSNLWSLRHGKTKSINIEQSGLLDRLCKALKCAPGDILQRLP